MKKIKLIILLIFTISCSNDDDIVVLNNINCNIVEKTIIYDHQDNVINIDGIWVQNSDLNSVTPVIINDIGVIWENHGNEMLVKVNPEVYKIISGNFINYNYAYNIEIISDSEIKFTSNNFMESFDISEGFTIKLFLKNIN